MTYANRLIEKTLMKLSTAYPAVLITGSRQVGKSTLLKHSIKYKNYITFDDPTILSEAHNDPKGFLNFYQYPLVIDEVQYLSSILKYLKIHIDETNTHGMYFLTGSQHFNLMQGVSESLAGRIAILELLGFSQREKFSINRIDPFIPTKTYLQANINLTNIKETQL
jgi:predicted AAA+ superfamily ATPase